ncbi:MAG: porin [Rhodobacteraceae bacterium]|nr:porin [Paracoccaceae bacterium]
MKKILLLSTIIVGTAGMAAADIRLSGGARFGIEYNGDNTSSKTMVHNRITINVDGTAEADNGLSFFARVRIRGNNTGDGTTKSSGVSAPRVGVTYEGLTVAAGNILGAIESMPGLYDGTVGLTGLDYSNLPTNAAAIGRFAWDSFSSNGGGANGIEAIYSMGDFSGHISYSGDNVANAWNPTGLTYERGAVYLAYSFGDWTAALAHQQSSQVGEEMTVVTVAGNFGDFGVGMAYSDNEGDNSALRVNGSYTFGSGTTITAFYTGVASGAVVPGSSTAVTPAGAGSADDAYGIGFTHSLGGATLAGGYSSRFDGENQADFGVRFNF